MDDLYQRIIDSYKKTGSVKRTAEELDTYPIKVRRVLITEGLWHSKTSDQVGELLEQGLSVGEIAERICISDKTVQAYMPYTRGQYGGEDRSDEAVRSEEYRNRKRTADEKQVNRRDERQVNPKGEKQTSRKEDKLSSKEEKLRKQREKEERQRQLLEELKAEKIRLEEERERIIAESQAFLAKLEKQYYEKQLVMKLHLELDLEYTGEEELEILRKYGRMEKCISRDILVPGTMSLHALHYAIQRAFGWQNAHLHSFTPNEAEFALMTGGKKVKDWSRLVGVYFRGLEENFEERYWDDDYDGSVSVRSWLRTKYRGPYRYDGVAEHYMQAHMWAGAFAKELPEMLKKTTDQRTWGVYFDGQCEEMLERLRISDVLRTPMQEENWKDWKRKTEFGVKKAEAAFSSSLKEYGELLGRIEALAEKIDGALEPKGKIDDAVWTFGTEEADDFFESFAPKGEPDLEMLATFMEMDELDRKMVELCERLNPETIAQLSELKYCYDSGDGWEVRISCTDVWYDRTVFEKDAFGRLYYAREDTWAEHGVFVDMQGDVVSGEMLERIRKVAKDEKPVCVAWDGMNVLDDVGGIGGFCHMLEVLHGANSEEKKELREWAKSMGWSGRMSKAENVL